MGNVKSGSWFLRCARPETSGEVRKFYASSTFYVSDPENSAGDSGGTLQNITRKKRTLHLVMD